MLECDIEHGLSLALLCMLNEIRSNPMHTLYVALLVPYVPVLITCGALVAHRYTHAPPCGRTSQ